jgi:hypothetical protein
MRFRNQREAGFAAIGPTARIAAGLLAIALVVAFNQTSGRSPSVLGTKVERCEVDGTSVALGPRAIYAEPLSLEVRNGKLLSALLPAKKVTPGATQDAPVPLLVAIGVRDAGKGRLAATVRFDNLSSCPIAVQDTHLSARRAGAVALDRSVDFGGRSRVVIDPGKHATARVVIPAGDGSWTVVATAAADIGASA